VICSYADQISESNYHDITNDPKKNVCPKEYVSFLSLLTFRWFDETALKGWRRPLSNQDMWDVRKADRCDHVFTHFNKYWKASIDDSANYVKDPVVGTLENGGSISYPLLNKSGAPNVVIENPSKDKRIFIVLMKAYWYFFLTPNVIKLASDILILVNPIILK
jgi:ATP-binding cassette subfamily C (CFTR/MRP) protein 1